MTAAAPARGARAVLRRVARPLLTAVALLAVALLLLGARRTLVAMGGQLHRLSPAAVLAGTGLVLLGTGLTVQPWRAVLADLGSPLALRPALRVYFLGQLGKYLPGSVWPVVAQMQLASRLGVPRARAASAAAIALLLSAVVALLVAALTLPFAHSGSPARYSWVFLALPAGAAVLAPPVLNRMLSLGLRLARRAPAGLELSLPAVLRAAGWSALSWLCFGAATWVVARSLGARGAGAFALGIAAFALAWVVGFLVLLAPAGAVARESALTVLLAPALPGRAAAALLVALSVRLAFTVADLLWGGAAALTARAAPRRHLPEPP